jgi:hypothetical protein
VHGNSYAFFLRYDELKNELAVVHIPQLDHSVLPAARNQVVLVKLVEVLPGLKLELTWRKVLEVCCVDWIVR